MFWKLLKYSFISLLLLISFAISIGVIHNIRMTPEERKLAREKAKKEAIKRERENSIYAAAEKARQTKAAQERHARRICKTVLRKSVNYPETLKIHWDSEIRGRKEKRQVRYSFTAKNGFGVPIRKNIYCNFSKDFKIYKGFFIQ